MSVFTGGSGTKLSEHLPLIEELPYHVCYNEDVRKLEESELKKALNDLKNELQEKDILRGIKRPISSMSMPQDASHFRRERDHAMRSALRVCQPRPIISQAELMDEQLGYRDHSITPSSDYTLASLPLLLYQFFLERIWELVQLKHLHMLRWKRFSQHTSIIESLYPTYKDRLMELNREYEDCRSRAERLAVARENFMAGKESPASRVEASDLVIYLQWLIIHLHSLKKFTQYTKCLQWLPLTHNAEFSLKQEETKEQDDHVTSRITARYQDVTLPPEGLSQSNVLFLTQVAEDKTQTPSSTNPFLMTTNLLPNALLGQESYATGGGLSSDEDTLGLPLIHNDLERFRSQLSFLAHIYAIGIDVDSISNTAQEMELYSTVLRKFRHIYTKQQHTRIFKTYDTVEVGHENWGADSSSHALKQVSNWTPFLKLRPEKDLHQEKMLVQLRQHRKVDELLRALSAFMSVADPEKVNSTIVEHAAAAKDPPLLLSIKTRCTLETSNTRTYSTMDIWKVIYTNSDLFNKENEEEIEIEDFTEKEVENVLRPRSSGKKRRSSYEYQDTLQLLGLDEAQKDESESTNLQGAYLSFLLLRQLRIRDLQRTCLSIFNYFRSLERTLTINDGGLSLDGGKAKQTSPQKHRRGVMEKDAAGPAGNIGCHDYIHNTPNDFKVNEVEFMEFEELENHDDFYTLEEGRVHVQDQRGYFIVYDSAIDDLKQREEDLLLIASHYLQQGSTTLNVGSSPVNSEQGYNIKVDGHAEADRFGILLDLWSNEAAFLEAKRQLVDAYFEAYQHITDRDEKRLMAQTITNATHRLPRLDYQAEYFIRSYRMECVCLRLETQLTKSVLDKQIEDQREHVNKYRRRGKGQYGLPYAVINKLPISVNLSRSALKTIYLMEFHPSLSIASRIPGALKHAYSELQQIHKPSSVTEEVALYRRLLEVAQKEWNQLQQDGIGNNDPIRKELFSEEAAVEDPVFMAKLMLAQIQKAQDDNGGGMRKDNTLALKTCGRILEIVTVRFRLMEAVWESDILAKIYLKQAASLGHGTNNLYLGPPLEVKTDPRITSLLTPILDGTEDFVIESYSPNNSGNLFLAIHELDNTDVGRLGFVSELAVEQLTQKSGGLENLQTVLMCQLVHRNTLMTGVQLAHAYHVNTTFPDNEAFQKESQEDKGRTSPKEQRATVTPSSTQFTSYGTNSAKKPPFFSVHLAKKALRDNIINEYARKKDPSRKPEETENIKRTLFNKYCSQIEQLQAQFSMRSQIIGYYNSIQALLADFPELRKEHFMIGEPWESSLGTLDDLLVEPGDISPRPRCLTTEDGRHVLNLWYIPHATSLMTIFKTKKSRLSDEQCRHVLHCCLRIIAALHDMLQCLCAHATMGTNGPNSMDYWGGIKGIVSELHQVQCQVDQLDITGKPDIVRIADFLTARRDTMLLEFDTAVRNALAETFLATGNSQAYQALKEYTHFGLYELSNIAKPCFMSVSLNVPEPLDPSDSKSRELYPWRTFINKTGPHGVHFWQWFLIRSHMQLCLTGLKDVDRQVANGEILGVTLLLEDVVNSTKLEDFISADTALSSRPSSRSSSRDSRPASALSSNRRSREKGIKKQLSKSEHPMESYHLMRRFLVLCKQLEVAKHYWGLHRLAMEKISTPQTYKQFALEYRREILLPVLKRHGHPGMVTDEDVLQVPKGVSEFDIRKEQMMKVLEGWESQLILEVKKKLVRDTNFVRAEHNSVEVTIPTMDVWKRPVIKDNFTVDRPHIAEDFISKLMQEAEEKEDNVTFSKEHLTACLNDLANGIMQKERSNYESYSMHYENMLRIHHRRLYQREQEVKQARDQLEQLQANLQVEVQYQLADTSQNLLLEVTALRSKVATLKATLRSHEAQIRDKVREEYSSLIKDLFNVCLHIQHQFDSFKLSLYSDVKSKIKDMKEKGIADIATQKQLALALEVDEQELETTKEILEREYQLKMENQKLQELVNKLEAHETSDLNETKFQLEHKKRRLAQEEQRKKIYREKLKMLAEEELILLREQLLTLRNTLRESARQTLQDRAKLEKEIKVKEEKLHVAQQNARSQKQLERAKTADYDKRLEKLEMEDSKLRIVVDEQERQRRLHTMKQEKIKKEVSVIKKQLNHERSLKLDAFQRVDDLQTIVNDVESSIGMHVSRPQTAVTVASRNKSRVNSAAVRSRTLGTLVGGVWPPPVPWPNNRSLTPGLTVPPDATGDKKVQRPKTTIGRLRSRIAEQLMHDLEPPDHHETLIKLRELQQLKDKTFITTIQT